VEKIHEWGHELGDTVLAVCTSRDDWKKIEDWIQQARAATVCIPDNEAEMKGLMLVATIEPGERCSLSALSWRDGPKKRSKCERGWEIWAKGVDPGCRIEIRRIAREGPGEEWRWNSIESNNEYGKAYYRGQGGGEYLDFKGSLVYSDGSLLDVNGETQMGYGVAFRPGDGFDCWGRSEKKTSLVASSMIPEADGLAEAIRQADHDKPLVVCSDSASVLQAIANLIRRDFSDGSAVHRHADHLGPVVQELACRRLPTTLVKVNGHSGTQGNDRADERAEWGRLTELPKAPDSV